MSEPAALQVKETGKPKGNTRPVDDEIPVAHLAPIPHNVSLDKNIADSDMVDVGKRHMFALLDHSAKTQNMNLRSSMRLHLEIATAVVSTGHTGIKLAQEAESAGLVADGAALLVNVFTQVKSTLDNPLVQRDGQQAPSRNLDIGEAPEDFIVKPGETQTGTHDIDPNEFKDQLDAAIATGK
jgi:hypothetical protein